MKKKQGNMSIISSDIKKKWKNCEKIDESLETLEKF